VTENPENDDVISNSGLLRDKKDIPVALGATNSGSDYLVTGDKELSEKLDALSITTSSMLQLILGDQSATADSRKART
jgi:predicted nucleic acid-binding protein